MLDVAKVNDTKTVDINVAEFVVADRLGYIGELYKQIAQLDFSKPVLEALLNYQEPVAVEGDIEFGVESNKTHVFTDAIFKEADNTPVKYRPVKSYTKTDFIKVLMEAYTDNKTNTSMSRIIKGITYRSADLMYNFMSLQMVKAPVNLMYYIRHSGAECSIASVAAELKTHKIFSSMDRLDFNDVYEDTIIDICSKEFESYVLNNIVDLSQKIDTRITAHSAMSSSDIVRIVAFFHNEFINIAGVECDYIILNKSMYAILNDHTSNTNINIPMLFGKPVFGNGDSYVVTFGINPNISRDYISGFPILMTDMLINSQSIINPITFLPSLRITTRHTIEYVGNFDKSIITFKCWDK